MDSSNNNNNNIILFQTFLFVVLSQFVFIAVWEVSCDGSPLFVLNLAGISDRLGTALL